MTGAGALKAAAAALRDAGIENAFQEARWCFEQALRTRSGTLSAAHARRMPCKELRDFQRMIQRRTEGEPLQYILGSTTFYGLELLVGPGVLIPRPETERLVDLALRHYAGAGVICDLCTGSGAIALALAAEIGPDVPILAADISSQALGYARRNLARFGFDNVHFWQGDLFAAVPHKTLFAMVTANPPYVSPESYASLPRDVKDHEPPVALVAADSGLALVRRVAEEAHVRLQPGGRILCEISSEHGAAAQDIYRQCGYTRVTVEKDYTGRDRIVSGCRAD